MPYDFLPLLSQASPTQILLGSIAALLLLPVLFRLCRHARRKRAYKRTEYAQVTNKTMREVQSDKGSQGEYELYLQTAKHLKGMADWLFNVYVPCPGGTTTEIDAILFHASGIYVIESKNYRGHICGSDRREQWTQCLKPGMHSPVQTYSFYNPLKQNQVHVDRFRAWLGEEYAHIPVYSVVLFGNQCSLKHVRLSEGGHIVDHPYNFPFIVNRIAAASSFSDAECVKAAYIHAYPLSQTDRATKTQHIDDTRTARKHPTYKELTFYEDAVSRPAAVGENHGSCPLCQGVLVTRTAKKGANPGTRFIGCSNFPACRYTQNINEDQ